MAGFAGGLRIDSRSPSPAMINDLMRTRTMSSQLLATNPLERIRVRYAAGDRTRTLDSSDPVLIGRGRSCDLRLEDLAVAHQHAEVYRVGELWWVRDLGTDDGTYLDEECIEVAPVVGLSSLRLGTDGPKIWLQPDASAPS